MAKYNVFAAAYADIHQLYIQKAERKGRTQAEVEELVCWLTGYSPEGLQEKLADKTNLGDFLDQSPAFNPKSTLITGVVCGVRVEDIEDPLMKKMRYLDKLIDELAKGRTMEKIRRA